MPDYNGAFTLYVHDSDCCIYLGVCIQEDGPYVGEYDLYTCLQGGYCPPTILARYGNDGSDYHSGLCFAAEYRNPVLWEGAKRAIALKLLTQEELNKEVGKHVIGSSIFHQFRENVESGEISFTVFERTDNGVVESGVIASETIFKDDGGSNWNPEKEDCND